MTYRLVDSAGTSYLDYSYLLATYAIKKTTLHDLLRKHAVPGVAHLNKVLYLESDVTALLAQHGVAKK